MNASTPIERELLLPKPEDALVDDLQLVHEIEGNILRVYYVIVSKISRKLLNKQQQLRTDVETLERLVPDLKVSRDICLMKGIAGVGRTSAVLINSAKITDVAMMAGHAQLVKASGDGLKDLADNLESQQQSLVLSPEAADLLRRIICQILDLQKPTEDLDSVSAQLTKASNDLRTQTNQIEGLMIEAITCLVEATSRELPTCDPTKKQPCPSPDLAAAKTARLKAIDAIEKAKKEIIELETPSIPDGLKIYLNDKDLQLSESELSLSKKTGVSAKQVRDLLDGTIKWIRQDGELSRRNGGDIHNLVSFKSSTSPTPGPWFPETWNAIRYVLDNIIPLLTDDRTEQLYRKKLRLIFILAGEDDQYDFFYRFLPKLKPPSSTDLDKDTEKRDQAARALARA